MEEVELMAMITWPDFSLTGDSLQLDCDAYASCTDTRASSLDLQIADRRFEDSAMSLGLLLDELLTEDHMGRSMELENMDRAISSSCVDPEEESTSFPACALNDRAGGSDADALTWGSLEMDMNLIADMSNVFHGECDDQELVQANSVGSPADMTIQAISSHRVSIGKLSSGRAVDWKKIIVKKSVLEEAVERLGGGKNGALKLWKLIQVWLKHQNHPQINGMSRSSAIADHGDLLCSSTSNADVSFQNKSTSSKSPNSPNMDLASLTDSHLQGIAGLKTPCCIASTQSEDQSCDAHGFMNSPASLLPKFDSVTNKPLSAASYRAARKNKMALQRRSIAHIGHHRSHQRRTFCSPYPSVHARGAYSNSFKSHPNFQNVQTCSTTQTSGKKESKSYLPILNARDGVAMSMKDKISDFKYRLQQKLKTGSSEVVGCGSFQPNKSQMHLLQNTGDFVKSGSSEKGDSMMLYKDCSSSEIYVIGTKRGLQTESSKGAPSKAQRNGCSPILNEAGREAGKFEEGSFSRLESSSSSFELESVDVLSSEAGKTKEGFRAKRRSFETRTTAEVSKVLVATIATNVLESSESIQSQLDCLMEEIMEEFGDELPVLERFPSLDTASIAQFDEILELHHATAVAFTSASALDCSSNCTENLAVIADDYVK